MEQIIYEDKDIIVLHKPGGLPVQTDRIGQKDLVSILKNYRVQKKEPPYIGVIHRLDQPVEGVLVFAKNKEAAARLSNQSKEHSMDKYYEAVVFVQDGKSLVCGEWVTMTNYLLKDGRTNTSKVVTKDTPGAKKAVLQYEVSAVKENIAKLKIRLETGRHHQIRVQMANAKMPLVGDKKYNENLIKIEGADKNIALCATKIAFRHPNTGKNMEFEIEPKNTTFTLV